MVYGLFFPWILSKYVSFCKHDTRPYTCTSIDTRINTYTRALWNISLHRAYIEEIQEGLLNEIHKIESIDLGQGIRNSALGWWKRRVTV